MHLDSAEDVLDALRESGLFAPAAFDALVRELAPLGDDLRAVMTHIIKTKRLTAYQLGKTLNGRSADLFIGRYIVTDRLGSGGMGKVYRARDLDTGMPVAIKVVRSALVTNPTVRGRYAREVQTTSQLSHPNIVSVFDAGEDNGKFYMAMEFVDGIDLARMMREFEVLAVPEACEYARQAALGLEHAHSRGIVHRDIKPSNIVVAGERHVPQATEPAVVKLLDLGLARALDPLDMVAPDLTRDHTVVGTPDYMAPEQAKDSRLVDGRADLYGLGCTLYFLLTGRVPFAAPGAIEKILAHQIEQPPPLQGLRREIPQGVAQIVMKLMAKRPVDRYQSAAEVAEVLEPHTRYPKGAPPVELTPTRSCEREPTQKGRNADTKGTRSTVPPSDEVSGEPFRLLELPDSGESPRPQPPAPRPRVKLRAPENVPPRERSKPKKPVRNELPAFVWVFVGLCGFVVLAITFWLATKR